MLLWALPVLLVAVLVWIGWRALHAGETVGGCCSTGPWPPVDLVDAPDAPGERAGHGSSAVSK